MAIFLVIWLWLCVGRRVGHNYWKDQAPATQLACALALGSIISAACALLLGMASSLGPLQLWVCLALGLFLNAQPRRDLAWLKQCASGLGPIGVRLLFCLSVLGALAPTTHFDTQIYHYTLPGLYLQRHAFYWTGTGITDGIFHLYHLILVWPLGLGGETCANLLGPVFLFILAQALAACLDQESLVYWLVYSSPALYTLSFGGLPELPAAAFVALSLLFWRQGREGLSSLWMGAALSTRLSAAPALVGLMLAGVIRERKPRAALQALLISALLCSPWMLFNLYHTGYAFYPLGTRWKTLSLVTSHSLSIPTPPALQPTPMATVLPTSSSPGSTQPAVASEMASYPNLLVAIPPNSNPLSWQDCLSPLLLGGLLLHLTRPRPAVAAESPGVAAPVLLCLAVQLLLAQPVPRYNLLGSVGLLVLCAAGWQSTWRGGPPWQRGLLMLGLAAGIFPGVASTLPRLATVCGWQSRDDYLKQKLPVYDAYQWLAGSSYRKVLLTDSRSWRCPKPFFIYMPADLLAASQPDGEESFAGLKRALQAQDCDLVLWNLDSPALLELTHDGDFTASNEDAQQWMSRQPEQFDYKSWRYRVLYQALHGGRVVYRQGTVVAVEWPESFRNKGK